LDETDGQTGQQCNLLEQLHNNLLIVFTTEHWLMAIMY